MASATLRGLLALTLAALALVAPAAAPGAVAADDDGLRLQVDAAYTVEPDDRLVRVVLDVTATNETPNGRSGDTVTEYYWDEVVLPIPEEASEPRAMSGRQVLRVAVKPDDGFDVLTVTLPRNLLFRQTQRLRIVFELPSGAPRSTSVIRVGQAVASFYAWAYGDDRLGDVRIVVPSGFDVTPSGSQLATAVEDGATVLEATDVAATADWYVQIDAVRADALTADRLDLGGGQRLRIRAWPEDDDWRTRVSSALEDGLPALSKLVGMPWPVDGELDVVEVHTPLLEGYAGVFDLDAQEIQIGEELDEHTILHEGAHAWFNDDLWTERWILEGFADEYAARALDDIRNATVLPAPVAPDDKAAVPLNDWTWTGSIEDDETDAAETYGYNASWRVVHALVAEVGPDAMRDVIAAAGEHRIAYVGDGDPEPWTRPNDWRRFLDLLEERGGARKAEATFRDWVITPSEANLLDRRADARAAYAGLLEAGDGWQPPLAVRAPLAGWDFRRFSTAAAEADKVLDARDVLAADAAALELDPPASLEAAYEGAERTLDAAEALVTRQQAGLDALEDATAAVSAPRDPVLALGLLDVTPEQDLADARAAWESDRQEETLAAAAAVHSALTGAADVGRTRAVTVGAVALGAVVLLVLLLFLVARRGRRRRSRPGPVEARAAYATLPAHSPVGDDPAPHRPAAGSDEPP